MFFAVDRSSTAPWQMNFYQDLELDRSWQIIWSIELRFLFKVRAHIKFHFSFLSLSIENLFSHPKHFSLTQISLPTSFLAYIKIKTLGKFSNLLSFHAFMHFRPRFWGFSKFLGGFWVFREIFGLGFVNLLLYVHALHSHCILTMFHAYRYVFGYWNVCW